MNKLYTFILLTVLAFFGNLNAQEAQVQKAQAAPQGVVSQINPSLSVSTQKKNKATATQASFAQNTQIATSEKEDNTSAPSRAASDLAVMTATFPYTQLAVSQTLPATLGATVKNNAASQQTNVILTVELNGQVIATSAATTINAGATVTINATVTNNKVPFGFNVLKYAVSQNGTASANIITRTLQGTTSIFALDNNTGAGYSFGNTAPISLGNIFYITESFTLSQVQWYSSNGTTAGPSAYSVSLYALNAAGTAIASTKFTSAQTNRTTTASWVGWTTATVPATVLTPGYYFLSIDQTGNSTYGFISDGDSEKNSVAYGIYSGTFTHINNLYTVTNAGALELRMVGANPLVNDLEIVTTRFYTQIPKDQAVGLQTPLLSATAKNVGTATQNNISLSVTCNGTLMGTSNVITSLGTGLTSAAMNVTPFLPASLGTKNLVYTIKQTEVDAQPLNNTESFSFDITNNVYALDNVTNLNTSGIGYTTTSALLGNVFTITKATYIEQVMVAFGVSSTALSYNIQLYSKTGTSTINTTALFTQAATRAAGWQTVNVPKTLLAPGEYFLCVQQSNTTNIGILCDNIPGQLLTYGRNAASGANIAQQTTVGAVALRMILSPYDPCTDYAIVGTGINTQSNVPLYSNTSYSYSQTIYTAADIKAAGGSAGMINAIAYNWTGTGTLYTGNWTVYIGTLPAATTAFTSTTNWLATSSMTNVYSGSVTGSAGWLNIPLTTSFYWNGSDNIVVAVFKAATTSTTAATWNSTSSGTGVYRTIYRNGTTSFTAASPGTATSYTVTNYPNIRFKICSPCDNVTNIAGCGSAYTQTASFAAGASSHFSGNPCYYSAPGGDKIYSFTPATTGVYNLVITAADGYVDYLWREGSCSDIDVTAANWKCIKDISTPREYSLETLTAGTTYYFLLDSESSTSARNHKFYIDCIRDQCTDGITVGKYYGINSTLPIYSSQAYNYSQTIYTASDMTAAGISAGNITSIAYYWDGSGNITNGTPWTIYIGGISSTKTNFGTTADWIPVSSMQQVYNGSPLLSSAGWITIPLSTPFKWDGTSNIVVAVHENTLGSGTVASWWSDYGTENRSMYCYSGSTISTSAPPTGTRTYYYPLLRMKVCPPCEDPKNVSVANINAYGATISWTAPSPAPASGYQIYVNTTNSLASATATGSVGAGVLSWKYENGLPNTTYFVWVRSNCGSSNFSDWVALPSFTTTIVDPCTDGIRIGTGTVDATNHYVPIRAWNTYSYSQTIYLKSELNAAGVTSGKINTIYYYWSGSTGSAGISTCADIWDIYIGTTSKTSFSNTTDWVTFGNLTKVLNQGTITLPASTGWVSIPLTTPFVWNGNDNIVVAVDEHITAYCNDYTYWLSTSATNRSLYYATDVAAFPFTSSTAGTVYAYYPNIKMNICPNCDEPTDLKVGSTVTTTGATISWTAPTPTPPSNGYYIFINTTNTPPQPSDVGTPVAGTSYIHTGTSNTTYYVWVRSYCGGTDYSNWVPFSYKTLPDPCADGIAIGNGTNAQKIVPVVVNNNAYSYTQSIYLASEITTAGGKAGNIKSIAYYWDGNGNLTNGDLWDIYIENVSVSDFSSIGSIVSIKDLQKVYSGTVSLPGGSGPRWVSITLQTPFYWDGTSNIVVAVHEKQTGSLGNTNALSWYSTAGANRSVYASSNTINNVSPTNNSVSFSTNGYYPDIKFVICPCPKPENLKYTAITHDGATLTWTAGGASNWVVEYSLSYNFTSSTIKTVSSPTITLTCLSENKTYYVRVKADCGGGTVSTWTTMALHTLCNNIVVTSLNENFTNGTWVPTCWRAEQPSTNKWNYPHTFHSGIGDVGGYVTSFFGNGDGASFEAAWMTKNDSAYLISPKLYVTDQTCTLKYSIEERDDKGATIGGNWTIDPPLAGMELYLEISYDGINFTTVTGNVLLQIPNHNTITNPASTGGSVQSSGTLTFDLTPYQEDAIYIRFKAVSDGGSFSMVITNVQTTKVYTVTYSTPEGTECQAIYDKETCTTPVTLPAINDCVGCGNWTQVGWTSAPYNKTTTNPGALLKTQETIGFLSSDATYYALYYNPKYGYWATNVDCTNVDIDIQQENSLELYPNPAQDIVNINISGIGNAVCQVTDLLGKTIEKFNINSGDALLQINVSNYAAGTYLVRITSDNKNYVQRFVVKN